MSKSLKSLALAALSVSSASAWWQTGHMLAARIAYDKLNQDNPKLLARANTVLSHIAQFTTLEKDYPFVECATFADDIKSKGWDDQSNWHFVDIPFFDGYTKADWYPQEQNVTWIIGELVSALKNANEATPENGGVVSWDLGDSFNLRLFIHYVGDIHQPLHAASRFTSSLPEGDRGGNSFPLTSANGVKQLHALWDSVVYEYNMTLPQPLDSTSWEFLGEQSARITSLYPMSSIPEINNAYATWDDEAFAIAKEFVYTDIKENTLPSAAYVSSRVAIAEKQLAKAGYRIALQLEKLWGSTTNDIPAESLFLQ